MVQRKVPSKLGIQADNVKSDERLANLKLSSSQNQDGKTRGADMKKKMKKPKSIKLSDMEILRSSPSKKSFSQPGKPPPFLHVPPTASSSSPHKQTPLIRASDGSPNYMKPTSSSDAKKELFLVSLRNSKANSKPSSVSGKKPAKTLTKSSPSLKLVRTLTKTPSFKKSSRVALCADMNAQRATCSSTLKDSKFPPYLMLNPGATESEGTSVMKVCPYTFCSLNGHRHAPLPPLKSFLSARRRMLKTQRSVKLEALSPRRLKVPCEPTKESETGRDFFIEIYAKKNGDEEDIKSTVEDNCLVAHGDDDAKQVIASLSDGSPKSEIDSEEDFGKYHDDVAIEAQANGSFLQEQEAEYADEKHLPIWSGEDISIGSYCSENSYEGEHLGINGMDGSNSEATDMEWEHEEDDVDSSVLTKENDSKVESLSESSHDVSEMWLEDIISIYYEDVLADEVSQESNPKENNHGIACGLELTNESLEAQEPSKSYNVSFEHPYLTEEVFEILTDAEENSGENETFLDATVFSSNFTEKALEESWEKNDLPEAGNLNITSVEPEKDEMVPNETTLDGGQENMSLQEDCMSSSLADQISDVYEQNQVEIEDDVAVNHSTPEEELLTPETQEKIDADYNKQIVENYVSDFSQDCCEAAMVDTSQGQKNSEACEVDEINEDESLERSTSIGEEKSTSKNWKEANRRKRLVQDEEEMRKFNPREPNFLPLVPDPEAEKVDLKHQMMDERKNAEEWMLDYALRRTVTKLAPARKRKVALLVEAFESVIPIPKCETHIRNKSSFVHARPVQACS